MTKNTLIFNNPTGMSKCTIFVTGKCNLACDYCYIGKKNSKMTLPVADKILNFMFGRLKEGERLEIGLFGGEPLLEFDLVKDITGRIQNHAGFDPDRVSISVVTNGTLLTEEILAWLHEMKIVLCISCDGPPEMHDVHRHFPDGRGSSAVVERNIQRALEYFPFLPVNAVYSRENLCFLPKIVKYLIGIGVRNIYLNPDISADWTQQDAMTAYDVYSAIGKLYTDYHMRGDPKYISLIDNKIVSILRGGYQSNERCKMGNGEYAFTPSGDIYPCERLVGSDEGGLHCIGNINDEFVPGRNCRTISCVATNRECSTCGIKDYCMNWCGCTNYHATGRYDMVSPFICASERAAIEVAFQAIEELKKHNICLSHHLIGSPFSNIVASACEKAGR